jgi:hypothetical protein
MAEPGKGESIRPRYGCIVALMAISGMFAGGMIAVAIGKVVGRMQRCTPLEGLPACNHQWYLLAGMIIGFITLPAVAMWRLRAGARAGNQTERS